MSDILTSPQFEDGDVLQSLVLQSLNDMEESLVGSGHHMAMLRAKALLGGAYELEDTFSGVPQLQCLQSISAKLLGSQREVTLQRIREAFYAISKHVQTHGVPRWAVNGEPDTLGEMEDRLAVFAYDTSASRSFEGAGEYTFSGSATTTAGRPSTYEPIPAAVYFHARALPGVPYTHEDSAKLQVMGSLLSSTYLHQQIRERGGAYGGGIAASGTALTFYSYRDPNRNATLDVFSNTTAWLRDEGVTEQDVHEARLRVFSSIDSPVPPSRKGLRYFHGRVSDEMAAARRARLLAVTPSDIMDVADRYLSPEREPASTATLGPAQPSEGDSTS